MVKNTRAYNSINYSISLRQPLLNISSIAAYQQSKAMVAKSDAELSKESSMLIIRIAEAYCNALFAEDALAFNQAHIKAAREQLQQAQMKSDKGFGTITEVNEAKAAFDMAVADGVDSQNSVEYNRRELAQLIGFYPEELCKLQPEKIVLELPEPKALDAWIDQARSSNSAVAAAIQEIKVAQKEHLKQRASRYPTIDLVAGRSYSESDNNYTIGSIYDTYSISLQASVPLYSGGYVSAAVRQAKAKQMKAEEQLSLQERQVESDVRKYYNGIVNGISQINAYQQAEKSEAIAMTGTEKGFKAGIRSNVDVLNAQQKYYESKRALAKSRYQYIMNRLMLKDSIGTLSGSDVEMVNSWFNSASAK